MPAVVLRPVVINFVLPKQSQHVLIFQKADSINHNKPNKYGLCDVADIAKRKLFKLKLLYLCAAQLFIIDPKLSK